MNATFPPLTGVIRIKAPHTLPSRLSGRSACAAHGALELLSNDGIATSYDCDLLVVAPVRAATDIGGSSNRCSRGSGGLLRQTTEECCDRGRAAYDERAGGRQDLVRGLPLIERAREW